MTDTASGTVDTVKEDIGTEPSDTVRRWKQEKQLALKAVDKWHKRGREVVERYRDEEKRTDSQFNILWSNTETMKPALYGQTPIPDVRRRITDPRNPDPVARDAAVVLERGLAYSVNEYDFDGVMQQVVEDYLLPGRGNARVRYIPTMALGEPPQIMMDSAEFALDDLGEVVSRRFFAGDQEISPEQIQNAQSIVGGEGRFSLEGMPEDSRPFTLGAPEEEVIHEEARCEYVFWEDYLESPARTWEDLRWVAYRTRLSRKQLKDQFPLLASKITLDWAPKALEGTDNIPEFFKKATVWEFWDKESRKVIVIAEGYNDAPLAEWDDPLELEGFFPGPRPLEFITTNDSRVPIPLFTTYQDQARELDSVTNRINKLTSALKVRGIYDKVEAAIGLILKKGDNELVGVDNFAELTEKGGLERLISFLPIERIAQVLQGLYIQREQIKRTIHEITGLSDIVRGQTDPRETKGAQVLKAEFSSLRLQNPQRQVQRYARDLLRLKAEIMAEHFGEDTLRRISSLELPDELQPGQKGGTWPQVAAFLRSDGLRGFGIEIETDSTIQPDAGKVKQEAVAMMSALAGFMKEALPVVQAAPPLAPLMGQLLRLLLRQFKPGRLVEETLDQALTQLEEAAKRPQGDDKAEREAQAESAKLQLKQQEVKTKAELDAAKLELESKKLEFERQQHEDEIALRREELASKENIEGGKVGAKLQIDREKIMAEHGPSIIDALQQAQTGIGSVSEQNSAAIIVAMQALTEVTENLSAAIQTIGGEKEIVFDKKRRPVGIRPVTSEGQTLQ